jgi:hypothetical protein
MYLIYCDIHLLLGKDSEMRQRPLLSNCSLKNSRCTSHFCSKNNCWEMCSLWCPWRDIIRTGLDFGMISCGSSGEKIRRLVWSDRQPGSQDSASLEQSWVQSWDGSEISKWVVRSSAVNTEAVEVSEALANWQHSILSAVTCRVCESAIVL